MLLLAQFDNRDIWYELVKCGTHSSNRPVWFDSVTSGRLDFNESIRTLIGFSFIEVKQDEGSYMMHPVLQDWCLHIARTEHDAKASLLDELALVCVGYMVPSNNVPNYWQMQRRLLSHADFVLQKWKSDRLTDNIAIWGAFLRLGNLYRHQGQLKEAEDMYQRALAGYKKTLDADHTPTLNTVNNLGLLYRKQGKMKKAEKMYQQALAGYEKMLDPDHTYTLDTVNNLGLLYQERGKLKEAEEMYQRALVGYKKVLGPDHISTLNTVNNLGILYQERGKLKETEEMFRQALAGYVKALGPDHRKTQRVTKNLNAFKH
ncbi:hypothetical protein PISL3812_03527 [Talaromyces islandicus]|uniref:Uncharacterized protein n=1 Tax=Talaromyces islandicus TaxID=28573 RepID=A0A0U1LV43_TALIS|nr:hypothetical protein PISL3812_03527 [Talaromyces islandicus]